MTFFRAFDCLRYSVVGSFLLRSEPCRCFLHLFSIATHHLPPPMRSRCSLPLWFSVFITSVHTFKPPPAFNYHPSSSHLPPAISLEVSPARSAPTTMLLLNLPSDLLVPLHLPVLLFTSSPPTLPSSSSFLRPVGNSRCNFSLCRELHTSPM